MRFVAQAFGSIFIQGKKKQTNKNETVGRYLRLVEASFECGVSRDTLHLKFTESLGGTYPTT